MTDAQRTADPYDIHDERRYSAMSAPELIARLIGTQAENEKLRAERDQYKQICELNAQTVASQQREMLLTEEAEHHAEHPPMPCLQPGLHPDKCVEHGSAQPPAGLWGDGTREMLIELRDWLRSKMPCNAGDCCNELRGWIDKVDQRITHHSPTATPPPSPEQQDALMLRSVGAMEIAEGNAGWQRVPIDCPMLAAVKVLRERYDWLAQILYCDYGDNQQPGEQIGWGIRINLRGGHQFMYGPSIDQAIDAAKATATKGEVQS